MGVDLEGAACIAVLVEDMPDEPLVPTSKKPCGVCSRDCWVADSLPTEIDGHQMQYVCGRCAIDLPIDWGEVRPAPNAVADIKQALGVDYSEEQLGRVTGMLNRAFSLGYTGGGDPAEWIATLTPTQVVWVVTGHKV